MGNIDLDVKAGATWSGDRWVYQMQDTHQWYAEGESCEKRGQQRGLLLYYELATEAYRIAYALLRMDTTNPGQRS